MAKSLHTPEYEYFRNLLVVAREKAGLTQSGVAERLGLPQSFVAKYERGERRLDVVEFIRICAALRADAGMILADVKKKVGE